MWGPEFIVAIVAIACATSVIKSWINKKNTGIDADNFDRLANAFIDHKKQMQKKVKEIETRLDDQQEESEDYSQIEAPSNEGSLTNDLRQKEKA